MTNKNSIYLQALTSFILDTKPYHSKLTSVQEIYYFSDAMSVNITERNVINTMMKGAWAYSYFSGGVAETSVGVGQPMTLHQLVNPLVRGYTRNSDSSNNRGAFKAFRDENTDLPQMPFAFDPTSLGDVGLSDAFIQRNGLISLDEPIVEGLDVFLSHGAYVFQVKQTTSTQPLVVGRFEDVYEITDGPFPIYISLPFTNADSLIIIASENNASQISLDTIQVTAPGKVSVFGLSSAINYQANFSERKNENLMAISSSVTNALAIDVLNPNSSVNRIKTILNDISAWLVLHPNANANTAITSLMATLNIPALPTSYDALFQALISGATPVLNGYTSWVAPTSPAASYVAPYVDEAISALSPGIATGQYSDMQLRETGNLQYQDFTQSILTICNIVADPIRVDYEEFTLEAIAPDILVIRGSSSGTIGTTFVGETFNSTLLAFTSSLVSPVISVSDIEVGLNYKIISPGDSDYTLFGADDNNIGTLFTATTVGSGTGTVQLMLTLGEKFLLTPSAKITVHYQAPLEAWSITSINPKAYDRPFLTSTRYGFIKSQTNAIGYVTILDATFPSTTVVLTATSANAFTMTSTADPLYIRNVTANVLFNDGRLAFTVIKGSAYSFTAGDKFYIEITNTPAVAQDLNLYYGYDTEPYDDEITVYNKINAAFANYLEPIGFGYDSRFIGYDVAGLGMSITDNAVDGRTWRLRALPDLSAPLNLHAVDGAYPVNQVSVTSSDGVLSPVYDMPNSVTSEGIQTSSDPDVIADLLLYYSTSFALEYLDVNGTWINVGTVPIGSTFNSATHGFTFTIHQAAKPFISGIMTSSWYPGTSGGFSTETITSGDIISWTIENSAPAQTERACITSRRTPRLIMYGQDFHQAPAAKWTLTWVDASHYRLQGIYTSGTNTGQAVFPIPGITIDTTYGHSYKNTQYHLHYTVVLGNAGMTLGDSISFETFAKEPTFLIYGSVSGWQPDAVLDTWYWNGKIGFKIPSAKIRMFDSITNGEIEPTSNLTWGVSNGNITCNRLRPDAPTASYYVICNTTGHWMLFRDGVLVGDGDNIVSDLYITLTLPSAIAGVVYRFGIQGHDYALCEGHDLAIVKTSAGRSPTISDFVLLERTHADKLQISVQPINSAHALTLSDLAPVTTDLRFVDHSANSNVPLAATSPETAVLTGWFGVAETKLNSVSSIAEFSDTPASVVVRAAATGEMVGVVSALGATASDSVIFRWDPDFHAKYLSLNAQATVVTLGSGLNESLHVNMRDSAKFLLSGGGLDAQAFFTDTANTSIADTIAWSIGMNYSDTVNPSIIDSGFTGFLPGYDNTPFDFELGTGDINEEVAPSGYFDAGVPLTDYFMQAQSLALLPSMTPQQQDLYNQLSAILYPYLDGGDIVTTTLTEFLANVGTSPAVPLYNNAVNWNTTSNGFGIPDVGVGMEITDNPTGIVSTAIHEGLTIIVSETGISTGYIISPIMPPTESIPPVGTAYANFAAAMEISAPGATSVVISFPNPVPITPSFYTWKPADASPTIVSAVTRVSDRAFTFAITSGEMKFIAI